jgi:hypothetical protein
MRSYIRVVACKILLCGVCILRLGEKGLGCVDIYHYYTSGPENAIFIVVS